MNYDAVIARYGVDKLSKSPQGREVLNKAREAHKIDLIQPNDPKFNRFYGKQVEYREQQKRRNEEIAKEMREKKEWEKKNILR